VPFGNDTLWGPCGKAFLRGGLEARAGAFSGSPPAYVAKEAILSSDAQKRNGENRPKTVFPFPQATNGKPA
jgi:hypothetical protein